MQKLDYLKGRVDRLKAVFQSYKVELRELSRGDAHEYEMRARDYETQIAGLATELTDVRARNERDTQFGGGKSAFSLMIPCIPLLMPPFTAVNEMTNKEIVQTAKNVQEESKASTSRALDAVNDAIQTGVATTKMLKDQTEQINRIDRNVDVVDSNIKEAEKALRQLVRRLATDRLVMVMIMLIVLGVIAAIVVGVLNAQGVLGGGGTPTPTNE